MQTTISQSTWPSGMSWADLAARNNISYDNSTVTEDKLIEFSISPNVTNEEIYRTTTRIKSLLNEQFLKVQIFYSSMTKTEIKESPKYDFGSFLVSLGGAISLYLGISIVSFFEIVEFVMRFLFKRTNQ